MTLHREVRFEDEICADLTAADWLHAEGDAAHYDRARALFPADVLAWSTVRNEGESEAGTNVFGAHQS